MSYMLPAQTDSLLGTIMLKHLIEMVYFLFFSFLLSDVLCMLWFNIDFYFPFVLGCGYCNG